MLTVTDRAIRSDASWHYAKRQQTLAGSVPVALWRVSWLPHEDLTEAQALAAMELADATGTHDCRHTDLRPWARKLGAELGIAPGEALARCAGRPEDLEG